MLRKELRAIVLRPKVFVPILAVLFIPLLYSGSFLWAFWDPYGHLDRLPVAVVNEDQGAKLDGEPMHPGDDVVKRLKEKHSFAWHLFTWIISITFMMIVQFLVTVFDNPGRFLAILLLIAQLVGSAGTYPIELVPDALQSLHPWLPMTHCDPWVASSHFKRRFLGHVEGSCDIACDSRGLCLGDARVFSPSVSPPLCGMDGNSGSNVMIEPCRLEGVLKRLGRLFALANIGIKQEMESK
ncbi:YhgE/Pip family protein [Geobacillus sp. Y412MC52]|uniref:YhgE/Pip family protein n=1 Tax=Geobacillus sp. (strain Y412MC52) TaxID=550542 RepID=UPI00018C13B2|nr:YhgE/Pip family protein [Geobacillus sp. Y412MC52]ADU93084.1 membrane protein-like protein [Geobacillus sp. Y412MC52]